SIPEQELGPGQVPEGRRPSRERLSAKAHAAGSTVFPGPRGVVTGRARADVRSRQPGIEEERLAERLALARVRVPGREGHRGSMLVRPLELLEGHRVDPDHERSGP